MSILLTRLTAQLTVAAGARYDAISYPDAHASANHFRLKGIKQQKLTGGKSEMERFLAQNHSAMTHLPIGAAILLAFSAIAALFTSRKEITSSWAVLSIIAFVSVLPTLATGVASAKGRFNGEGKPFVQDGLLVSNSTANTRLWRHQILGTAGAALSAMLAFLGVAMLRGRSPNQYLIVLLALILVILWVAGGHLGGEELWGPDTFPAFK